MPIDPSVLAGNAAEFRRLENLTDRLTDADQDLGNDWTVAATLAHLAFW